MTSPELRATYRLQLGPHLGFVALHEAVDYLDRLGISHLYLSPIWKARSGSTHGYDVVDPTRLDPVLGEREDLEALAADVHRRGMGIVCDIVPNHMAAWHENPWWWDVLRAGADSPFARLFDIDWERGEGEVVLPVLGGEPDEVAGELVRRDGVLRYHDRMFPDPGRYRLAYWRTGEREINYRRFFDITDLVATRMDDPELIDETHALVYELASAGTIDGVRVDHVDGLRDPARYLAHLRSRLAPGCRVWVEKILARGERLPHWACDGTTGYEWSDVVEAATLDPAATSALAALATRLTGEPQRFGSIAERSKREVLQTLFEAEVASLSRRVAQALGLDRELSHRSLVEATVGLPVYRTYVNADGCSPQDRALIGTAVRAVRSPDAADALRELFTLDGPAGVPFDERLDLVGAWQQLCAPAMAKGVEDTALYRYVPLLSRNEVGAEPGEPSLTVEALHAFLQERARDWPLALDASSTHDSKRSEDVRARLDALTEVLDEWTRLLEAWTESNVRHKRNDAPDAIDELFVYQTIVGIWPAPDAGGRVRDVMRKSVRESKRRSDWRRPDEDYETALDAFIDGLLDDPSFTADLSGLIERLDPIGRVRSLARLVVKLASPGVPDLYQGTELWHHRLVDPDNREPVDLCELAAVLSGKEPTHLKLSVTQRALTLRREMPEVFTSGSYIPLTAAGVRQEVIAFARHLGERWAVACVPRFGTPPPRGWTGATLALPGDAPTRWRDALTDREIESREGRLSLGEVFGAQPVALLAPR